MAGPIPWGNVPGVKQTIAWNRQRVEKRAKNAAKYKVAQERYETEERGRQQGMAEQAKSMEHHSAREATAAPITGKEAPLEGVITKFDAEFTETLVHGYKRSEEGTTSEAAIRTTLRRPEFIVQVVGATADSALATPVEEADIRYAETMPGVRRELAEKLASGTISGLTVDELDILYTAMLGNGSRWGADGAGLPWPKGEPTPPEAFFSFLAATAKKEAPGREDEFMAGVLLTLAAGATRDESVNESARRKAYRTLADVAYVEGELGRRADAAFEHVVATFKASLDETLTTPRTELSGTDAAGYGYECRPGVRAAVEERTAALDAQKKAQADQAAANAAYTGHPSKANEDALRAADAAVAAAGTRVQAANQRLVLLVPELATLQRAEATALVGGLLAGEERPAAISRAYEDSFRSVFIDVCRNGSLGADDLKAALGKLGDQGNPLLMSLVEEAKQAADTKARGDIGRAAVQAAALEGRIAGAQLPEQVRGELNAVAAQVKDREKPAPGQEDIQKIADRYAYAAKNAAFAPLVGYMASVAEPGELPVGKWIATRMRFEGAAKIGKHPAVKYDGKLAWIARDWNLICNGQWPENNLLKLLGKAALWAVIPYYPAKLFVKFTFRNENFHLEVRNQGRPITTKTGKKVPSRWKRKHTGILQAAVAAAIVAEIGAAYVATVRQFGPVDGTVKFFTSSGFPYIRPAWNYLSAAPGNIGREPWAWWSPQLEPVDRYRANNDDMNIPERLQGRGRGYCQKAYGVGCDSSTDTAAKEAGARLAWLRARPGVLQFFQERTTGVHVNGWRLLPKGPSTMVIAPVKKNPQDTAAVTYDTSYNVLRMDTVSVADGLVLNTASADAFVDTLRAHEARKANGTRLFGIGRRIDYAYMEANKLAWEDQGFLTSTETRDAMVKCRIKGGDNAQFLAIQPNTRNRIEVRAELGRSTEYIAQPDAFVKAWRERVAAISGVDPVTAAAPEWAIADAFDSTRAAEWGRSIRGCANEFEQRTIMEQVKAPNMSQTTLDILAANQDIRRMLLEFTTTQSGYGLAPGRLNDFVQRLLMHKNAKGSIADYSPFSSPPGGRVAWAMKQGYFNSKQMKGEEGAAPDTAMQSRREAAKAIPLSSDAAAFYDSPGGSALNGLLNEVNASDGGRERLYKLLTGNPVRVRAAGNQSSITVSGSGAGMTATIGNAGKARKWLAANCQ